MLIYAIDGKESINSAILHNYYDIFLQPFAGSFEMYMHHGRR